jgi:glycosyltransferase involved in cell wall biosynthesis
MNLTIITHVQHFQAQRSFFAYAPYVCEMNRWSKNVNELIIVAPLEIKNATPIDLSYTHQDIDFRKVPIIEFTSLKSAFQSMVLIPNILLKIYQAMKTADHIHLRCPGNMGLLGCLVQIFFPSKPKTAKYAGNWDPKSKQPWTYRLQKWILSNTWLTKNMQVLVYGDWPKQTKNVKPFFTATYSEKELEVFSAVTSNSDKLYPHSEQSEAIFLNNNQKTYFKDKFNDVLKFIFVGTLTKNKRPLLCVEVAQQLKQQGYQVQLELYGEGPERHEIENYILDYHLQEEVLLKGNVSKEELKSAYQSSHFLLFFSQSEGWPKAVAESMFWGCIPITTVVSCVPYMLGNGTRGALVKVDKSVIIAAIENYVNHPEKYKEHALQAMDWSRQYTLEKFEEEIAKLFNC